MNTTCDDDEVPGCATLESPDVKQPLEEEDAGDATEKPTADASKDFSEPYFFTQKDEVTSEVRKIQIEGFSPLRIIAYKEMKTILVYELNLKPHRIKITKKFPQLVFAMFRCEEDTVEAIKKVTGFEWKGQKLFAKRVNPVAVPLVKKRKLGNGSEGVKKPRREKMRGGRDSSETNMEQENKQQCVPTSLCVKGKTIENTDSVCEKSTGLAAKEHFETLEEDTGIAHQKPMVAATEECSDLSFNTKPDDFDPEDFQIQLKGLPRRRIIRYNEIDILLMKTLNLKPLQVKITTLIPQSVFVTFRCEEEREEAIKKICGFAWKGCKLFAKKAVPLVDRSKVDLSGNSEDIENLKIEKLAEVREITDANVDNQTDLPVTLVVKNTKCPLWKFSYDVQLRRKQKGIFNLMKKLTRNLKSAGTHLATTIEPREGIDEDLCCPMEPLIGSPTSTGYLNTCYFDVGFHPETGLPTVGYCISGCKDRSKCVAEATPCSNVPDIMKKCAELFQTYIEASTLPVFNPKTWEGCWRNFTVRTSRKEHLLLVAVLHPQSLSEEEIMAEKSKLKEYFLNSDVKATSLYLLRSVKKEPDEPPQEHICGSEFIEEELLGLTFRIRPGAFFQVNTLGAEVLYKTLSEFVSLTKETTVVDLCCGTGTTGIILAKHVRKVIGVDLCQAAVEDAIHNAQANGIKNAEFLCGKVEKCISKAFKKEIGAEDDNVVVIVEPLKTLDKVVIKAIRGVPRLKQLVYLSCNPYVSLDNFVDLCRPVSNKFHGSPFLPVKAVPVDLLPQTNQCELIVLFEK